MPEARQCDCQELSSEALAILLGIDADHIKLILGEATEEKKGEICQKWEDYHEHGIEMTKELDELFANLCQQHKGLCPQSGPRTILEGKTYRVHIENIGIPSNATAADILRFERDELGNDLSQMGVSEELLKELDNYRNQDVIWVTKKKADAEYYLSEGMTKKDISIIDLPKGSRIIADDQQGGYLVLRGDAKPIIPTAEAGMPEVTGLYAKPPGRHEVPQFGEVGAVPKYTPSAEGRRRIIESRLRRGEPVSAKLLVEFPDLVKAIPKAEAGKVTPEAEINQIVADLNLLREEKVWIDTFKTKGASIIHIQTGETATIIEPPQTIYPFANYEERAMHIKWADGSEMVVDSNDFAPSALQKQIAEITHGKPIPPFPEAGKVTERKARYGFLQLNEAEYHEAVKSGKYPHPARHEKLTAYYPEPHEPGWKGLSLAEMFPTKYKDLLERGVPDKLSPFEVKTVIEEKRIPYGRGVEPKWTPAKESLFQKDLGEMYDAGKEIADELWANGYRPQANPDGTITIYHGTTEETANAIRQSGRFNEMSFFSHAKSRAAFGSEGAKQYGKSIIEVKVDPRDVFFNGGTGEIEAELGLVRGEGGIWRAPNRVLPWEQEIPKAEADMPEKGGIHG